MGATPIITRVLAQFEELLDIHVPCFKIRADRALALAALIHRNRRVVHDFKERHHALRFAVGALDM